MNYPVKQTFLATRADDKPGGQERVNQSGSNVLCNCKRKGFCHFKYLGTEDWPTSESVELVCFIYFCFLLFV